LAGKLLRHCLAIFWPREAGKVSFPLFFDAASPKTVFLSDFNTLYFERIGRFAGLIEIKIHTSTFTSF